MSPERTTNEKPMIGGKETFQCRGIVDMKRGEVTDVKMQYNIPIRVAMGRVCAGLRRKIDEHVILDKHFYKTDNRIINSYLTNLINGLTYFQPG